MAKITPEILQRIKESVSIVDVIGEHVNLRKAGVNYRGICPFHGDRNPSFDINESKGMYICRSCGAGGDLIKFVQEIHGLSFPEAVEELADRAKIRLPDDWSGAEGLTPEQQKAREALREKRAKAYVLNYWTAQHFRGNLKRATQVEEYFRKRGLDDEMMREFLVGAAMPGWDDLTLRLMKVQAPMELAAEIGLIKRSTKVTGPGWFDLFRDRAIFPIIDTRGKVTGFGGRIMDKLPKLAHEENAPKYLNSSESLIYTKGKQIFGIYQAQKHIREEGSVILVEGYFDVVALYAAGFRNVVAVSGTALTEGHLSILRRLAPKAILLFDGDRAGIAASLPAMERGLEAGWLLHGAAMPPGADPDELLFDQETGRARPEGVERMKEILGAAQPILQSRINEESRAAAAGPEPRSVALKKIAGWLSKYRDEVAREVWVQEAQTQLGVSAQLVERAMAEASAGAGAYNRRSGTASATATAQGPKLGSKPAISSGPGGGAVVPQAPRLPQPRPIAERPERPKAVPKLIEREKLMLVALARGDKYVPLIAEARGVLPPNVTFSDLFEYPPAITFTDSLFTEPGFLERFRAAPELLLTDDLDSQLCRVLREALISQDLPEVQEIRLALSSAIRACLARFSQQFNSALASAEANKDEELVARLQQTILDVQRKIKDFTKPL